ncbi:transporter substrate-binding domain-containing protein [Oscillospiraceae bacterium PP1C4]
MKSIKKISALFLAMTMAVSLAACGGKTEAPSSSAAVSSAPASSETSEASKAPATEDKTYIIATDTTFAPFEFEDASGKKIGIDMDLIAAIAEDQGFKYEIQSLGFSAAVTALEAKQCDGVIAGMSITEERKAKFDFSEPYFDSGVVMGIAEKDETIKSYENLKGKNVAIKVGTEGAAFAESIKDQYGFTVTTFDDSANMYEDVKAGNSVACFEDYPVLGYAVTQGVGLKIVTEKEKGSSYGFAVSKGENAELLTKFNAGLKNLKDSGKYQEILDTYIAK